MKRPLLTEYETLKTAIYIHSSSEGGFLHFKPDTLHVLRQYGPFYANYTSFI